MKFLPLLFLTLLLGLVVGCEPDPCEFVACGPGDCFDGVCDCPDGFSGVNCEIEECVGVSCINGDCDPQSASCNCHPNYYGESCDILCVNGEFAHGDCDCSEGYEGITCETESRCRFLGWWSCDQWTIVSQPGASPTPVLTRGSIKVEEGFNIVEIELFPTENSSGLMLLSSDDTIVGQVTGHTINFEFQYLSPERTVYGSASLGESDRIFSIELYLFNPTTSFTEIVRGSFRLARNWKG